MKGTYCLVVNIAKDSVVRVGALGKKHFEQGHYVYIGSALNSLEKRVERHLKGRKKKHWHIDYLLAKKQAKIAGVFVKESKAKEECKVAEKVARIGKAIEGFGCSDCSCKAHLFRVNTHELEKLLKKEGFRKWRQSQ
ncbi:MAG: GIY-YIG nuclease family protein [Candidatus Diapherotrites archaeon]|nr:GIY-YIG nuclease family protein [Candidatus Diapherotrites archaeon]